MLVIDSIFQTVRALILHNDRSCEDQPVDDTLTEANSDIFSDCERQSELDSTPHGEGLNSPRVEIMKYCGISIALSNHN